MPKSVDFYYDYISTASYLAWTQLEKICAKTGATINYKPIFLGGLFKAAGNTSPAVVEAKFEWFKRDAQKYATHYGVPFQMNPYFIFNTVNLMRGAIWAKEQNRIEDYNKIMFEAIWANAAEMTNPDVLKKVLEDGGFDVEEVLAAMSDPGNKAALIEETEAAAKLGAFGAPTFIVDGELIFGQDRLHWVEQALENNN